MTYLPEHTDEAINVSYNHMNLQVFQLLEDLEAAGNVNSPRGLKVKEANMATLECDPYYPLLDFKSRRFNWRYFAGELAWYLKANTSIDFIGNFSSFWKDICPNGHANSNYGSLLFNVHPSQTVADYDGSKILDKHYHNQLEWIYNSLVKDKSTRQAVGFFNAPYFQYEGNKDFVCTMYINFWIRQNYLDMKVQMRSNDIFFGLTYDSPWFSTIMQSMYLNLKETYPELKLGIYYHCADNIHFYERHFEIAEKILDDGLDSSVQLKLKHPLFEFSSGKMKLTDDATNFVDYIDGLVDSKNLPKEQNFWETSLGSLFEISR